MAEFITPYDKWFYAQVQEALNDPRLAISHEEVKKEFAQLRSELAMKAKSGSANGAVRQSKIGETSHCRLALLNCTAHAT